MSSVTPWKRGGVARAGDGADALICPDGLILRLDYADVSQGAAIGAVDLLCCHIPPALPELTYDVTSGRSSAGVKPC